MKKILFILFTLLFFIGCNKDKDQTFDIKVDAASISFTPVKGGARMSYVIPESDVIYAITVTYTNAVGEEVTIAGSYGSTELDIKGFSNAQSSVPAKVAYINRSYQSSEPIDVTFATLEPSTLTIFDNLTVVPHWSGFSVNFDASEDIEGLINIGYWGENPLTGKFGIIIKETRLISAGENRLIYRNISNKKENIKVVIWTEDFAQNEVMRKTFEVMPNTTKEMDNSNFTYSGDSKEHQFSKVSWKYLFDGDTKGIQKMTKNDGDYLFITEKPITATYTPTGVIDIKEAQSLAFLRVYAPLNLKFSYMNSTVKATACPRHMRIYASNNPDPKSKEWVKLGEYNQSADLDEVFWWNYPMLNPDKKYTSVETLTNAGSCYMDIDFDVSDDKYRYIMVEFLGIYREGSGLYAISSEMELFIEE